MSKQPPLTTRRQFVRIAGAAVATLPLAGVMAAHATGMPKLSEDDATARALGYVHETTTAGQQCNNCNFWQGGDAAWGGCPLFPGKDVSAKGWCRSWLKKA